MALRQITYCPGPRPEGPGAALRPGMKPWADRRRRTAGRLLRSTPSASKRERRKIVVDTCFRPGPLPEGTEALRQRRLVPRRSGGTQASGRDTVDLVICTHLHVDHVGLATPSLEEGRRVPYFSKRPLRVLPVRILEHWAASEEERMASGVVMFDNAVTPLVDFGVLDLVDTDHRLSDAIEFVPTPGHSPGHFSVRVASQGETAFITGDGAHSPIEFAEPEWYAMNDTDPRSVVLDPTAPGGRAGRHPRSHHRHPFPTAYRRSSRLHGRRRLFPTTRLSGRPGPGKFANRFSQLQKHGRRGLGLGDHQVVAGVDLPDPIGVQGLCPGLRWLHLQRWRAVDARPRQPSHRPLVGRAGSAGKSTSTGGG